MLDEILELGLYELDILEDGLLLGLKLEDKLCELDCELL